MTSANENIRQLEGLFREDGAGGLLVCYETGREKPHADSSYQLYPVDPDRKGMTYQFLSLLHVGVETARISAFIPDTRMEVYRFPRMSGLPPFYRDTPVKEYITGMLLPHIKRNRLKPVVSVNLRDMVFIRSEGLSVEPGGILRLDAGQIDRLVEFRRRQDGLAARYKYIPGYKLPLRVIETPKGVLVFSGGDIGREGTETSISSCWGTISRCTRLPVPSGNTAWIPLPEGCTGSPTPPSGKRRKQAGTYSTFSTRTPISGRRKERMGVGIRHGHGPFRYGIPPPGGLLRLPAGREQQGYLPAAHPAEALRQGHHPRSGFRLPFRFKEFVRRMDDCVNGLSKGDSMEKILEEMREKSDRILRTDFLVRGYGTPERVKRNRVEKTERNNRIKR